MRPHLILLGYQVGTGEGMTIPLGHMAVVGVTQQSGKTTTLESLAHRAGRQVLAFVTKRGEGSFGAAPGHSVRAIEPYFRERADWQFVEAILEATMRERMKYERQWIMRVSRGARTLQDVRLNTRTELEKARSEFMRGVYEKLLAYLDIVVPQIHGIRWAPSVQLHPCLNVMNLDGMSSELQALVIASCLDYVMANLKDVIVIVPEAWEFIPRGRKSPVTLSAEAYVRKGAALRNYLWIDSQDLAGVHTPILKQVTVWLLGVQREINEVKRTLAHVPQVPTKLKPHDITTLGLGQFYVVHGGQAIKTYVQPWWMDETDARRIAIEELKTFAMEGFPRAAFAFSGFKPAESHRPDHLLPLPPEPPRGKLVITDIEDPMDTQLKQERDNLKAENQELREQIADLRRQLDKLGRAATDVLANQTRPMVMPEIDLARESVRPGPDGAGALPLGTWPAIRAQILNDEAVLARVAAIRPELVVEITPRTITIDGASLKGRIARLIAHGFFNDAVRAGAVNKELNRTGGQVHPSNVARALADFVLDGYVTREGEEYRKAPALRVTTRELQAV